MKYKEHIIIFLIATMVIFISIVIAKYPESTSHQAPAVYPDRQQAAGVSKRMDVSAYCPCEKCCGESADGITASGSPAVGFLVAAPPNIPFGSLVSVPGYANGEKVPVLDRGGAIQGNKLDMLFSTHQEALNWGRQKLTVKIWEQK